MGFKSQAAGPDAVGENIWSHCGHGNFDLHSGPDIAGL